MNNIHVGQVVRYGANTAVVLAVKRTKVEIEITTGVSLYQGDVVWVAKSEVR